MRPQQRPPQGRPGTVRAFFALPIPADCRTAIGSHLLRLRSSLPAAKWVRSESLHLTLKFLGEAEPAVLQALAGELREPLAALPAVTVTLAGTGVFPGRSRARVAWIGGSAPGIEQVVAAVEAAAARHGCKSERRPWSLHLTLARLREPWPVSAVDSFVAAGAQLSLPPFRCGAVLLLASELRPTGAVYTALQQLSLAGLDGNGGGE